MTKPDRWMVIRLESVEKPNNVHYRVFATWGGGYTQGQSWKLNSGISSVQYTDPYFHFKGDSGSVYTCHKESYGAFSYGLSVLSGMIEDSKQDVSITVMPEETDWATLKYS